MANSIATNFDLVKNNIARTASSRDDMIRALTNLEQTINQTAQWQGVDAESHKAALLDFSQKLKSSAAWMEAAGAASIDHAKKLIERAERDQNARIFE